MDKEKQWLYIRNALVIVVIISIGLWGFNQLLKVWYNEKLLMTPCQLCVTLNPEWERCYHQSTITKDIIGMPVINFSSINLTG